MASLAIFAAGVLVGMALLAWVSAVRDMHRSSAQTAPEVFSPVAPRVSPAEPSVHAIGSGRPAVRRRVADGTNLHK